MNLETLQLAFETPRYLSPSSAWVEHIPFGFAVMDMLRPTALAELGTYKGDSYCAFCQAVEVLGLDTRCTAVDTWEGDKHGGNYQHKVLDHLRQNHDERYGKFSRLLQATFDAAAEQFGPGSIDLLHIDGLHTYEAVRHDFEAWLPKVSERGVVLMHDTYERRDDFGVWKLWEELSVRYPSFEFFHGHGLGVLAVGPQVAPGIAEFMEWGRTDPALVRKVFETLGDRMQLSRQLLLRGEIRVNWAKALRRKWRKRLFGK